MGRDLWAAGMRGGVVCQDERWGEGTRTRGGVGCQDENWGEGTRTRGGVGGQD